MCGIVAQFVTNGPAPDRRRLRAMAEDIRHRGPDGEGFHFGDWFGLGHKRLAILDPSPAGAQPMFDETGRFVITYNGELYNFKELRQDLEKKGHVFRSNSDTEVLLKSYIEWGEGCLTRFTGMFAFIIVDTMQHTAIAARDHLGIKPLFYHRSSNGIVFSSEAKAIGRFIDFDIEHESLYEHFFYHYVSDPRTLFKNILKVPAGSHITFDLNNNFKLHKYYDVCDNIKIRDDSNINFEEIEKLFQESIRMHTVSDVGYCIQLSGGVDSSYITAVLSEQHREGIDTYAISLGHYEYDESPYQHKVRDTYHTVHHEYKMTGKELADNLPLATWHMDGPIFHTPSVMLMLLCRHSRETSKVILSGEGADEMFGGYKRYMIPTKVKLAYILRKLGLPYHFLPPIGRLKGVRNLLSRDIALDQHVNLPHDINRLFSALSNNLKSRKEVVAPFPDLLSKMIASDQTSYLASLLERQDKMSMAMSVETRVPLCSPPLFDYINSINPKKKINPMPKMILKKLAERYFSKEFVYRPKVGFFLPCGKWLQDASCLGGFLDILTDNTFRERGYYNQKEVKRAIAEHKTGVRDRSKELMLLLQFEIWHRMYIDEQGTSWRSQEI